jgi:ABC-type nitrate/sulfonate/bicarbonate transport system substrate-binding protein
MIVNVRCRPVKAALIWAVVAVITLGVFPSASRAADADVVKLMFNPGIYDALPLELALDKGYFAAAHLDVRVTKTPGSLGLIVPFLARGDIDIAPQVMVPAFFNQYTQGFGIKLIATLDETHKGWNDTVYFMVRQDLWDAKKIRTPADLRGMKLPKPTGSPNDFLTLEILAKAGLTMSNVSMNVLLAGQTSFLPSLINKQFDALSVPEPLATQFAKQGIAHRWLGYQDVIPYFQTGYIAVSPSFAKAHRDAVQRFVEAYLRACRDIASANGKWTPELIDEVVKWSGQNRDVIAAIPGPAYPGVGKISVESITRQERLWLQLNMLQKDVPIGELIDESYARNARAALGMK